MSISNESFTTLLKHDMEVINNYVELKQRINGLLKTLQKIKRIKKEVKEELDAYIKLIEISFNDINNGNKIFEKWTVNYLDSLPKMSDETKDKLDEFRKKIGTKNIDETIQELFIVFKSHFKEQYEIQDEDTK